MYRLSSTRHFVAPLFLALAAAACSSSTTSVQPVNGAGGQTSVSPDGSTGSGLQVAGEDPDEDGPGWGIGEEKVTYAEVVRRVTGMVNDSSKQQAVSRRGLDLINLTWEDTGRFQGSSVGPNISDLTLQVRFTEDGQKKAALLPVIRFPNFSDRTGDISAGKFFVRIGNQKKGGAIETVPIGDVLKDIKSYVSDPKSILGNGNLLAPSRDSHFLVSAQAVFLPIPKKGRAEFTPVLFNYQSFPGSPAVLTMLVTRQGTSITVVENKGDEASPVASWGQELFFNKAGQRAPFTAERKSDVEKRITAQGGPQTADDKSALAKGADTLFIIQVPLKQRNVRPAFEAEAATGAMPSAPPSPAAKSADAGPSGGGRSDVEQAVLGHGKVEGPYFEGRGLKLERDERFPIRITVQFYKATSNGVVDDADLDKIATSIGSVYEHADFVGSLVLPEGDPRRPTAWQTMPASWFPW